MEYEYNAPFVSDRVPEAAREPPARQIDFLMREVGVEKSEAEGLLRKYKAEYLREGIEELRRCNCNTPKNLMFDYIMQKLGWMAEKNPSRERGMGLPRPEPLKKCSKTEAKKNVVKLKKVMGEALAKGGA